jgi:hypothetical protein
MLRCARIREGISYPEKALHPKIAEFTPFLDLFRDTFYFTRLLSLSEPAFVAI